MLKRRVRFEVTGHQSQNTILSSLLALGVLNLRSRRYAERHVSREHVQPSCILQAITRECIYNAADSGTVLSSCSLEKYTNMGMETPLIDAASQRVTVYM